ncbi:BPSS1780 family membrane protein [Deefgea salmonis]|uniref:Transmembrane protein n=1 Tax=Deefgea salmonis TaxID=2875502 RepID=A0ABS8BLF3_9NEIS|nr:BPSS1780 family membrane protein [Deefgea salmonis]MCB5196439.1 hypothetical protein [Deefgea salmonis]
MLEQDNVIDVSIEPKKNPAMQGWYWIVNAFKLFKQEPTVWVGICSIFVAVFFSITLLPIIGGFIATLLGPVFLGGIMWTAQKQVAGETPQLIDLFSGFKLRFVELLKVGVLYMFGTIFVMVLMTVLLAIASFFGFLPVNKNIKAIESLSLFWPLLIITLFSFLIVYSAYFYAPTLVMLQGMKANEAMKLSFIAFWRNWQPILIMSMIGAVFLFLAMLPMFLGLIVALPVALLTSYICYVDVF